MNRWRAVSLLAAITVAGAATIPRQLDILRRSLAPTGNAIRDTQHALMEPGLTRVVVVDRLVPPPTAVLAGVLLLLAAQSVLALGAEHRDRLRAAIVMGLLPLVVQRAGELAVSILMDVPGAPTPGLAVSLPQQFVTGPALFWDAGKAPAWVEAVSARFNLVTLGCVTLWAVGLQRLERESLNAGHFALPSACLVAAGVVTWWSGPLVLSIVLGRA